MPMTRAEVKERAQTDPAYAAVLGLCHLERIDDDTLMLALGRGLMAVSAMESNGWMLVRAPPAQVECPRCGGNGMQHGGVCDECGGLRTINA